MRAQVYDGLFFTIVDVWFSVRVVTFSISQDFKLARFFLNLHMLYISFLLTVVETDKKFNLLVVHFPVADLGEGPGGPVPPPLIVRPN